MNRLNTRQKRYRSEWKYCIPEGQAEILKERLSGLMERDAHAGPDGGYRIQSLYFDDLYNTCARENIAGERERFKYRIRYYGACRKPEDPLFLERKEKRNAYCHKDSCRLTDAEYRALFSDDCGECLWTADKPLLRRFAADILRAGFMPKSVVEYERTAFIEPISNVRITFDRNLFASDAFDSFLSGDYERIPILKSSEQILEVKFDDVLPSYIRNALQAESMVQQAFSKYYMSRITLQHFRADLNLTI